MKIFNPTGGLIYHLRARRYRDSLWLPFRQQVARFLDDWHPPEKELLILGPSGGYTLPTDFLQRFDQLWLFDPDPFAPRFFKKNHPGMTASWSRENLILDHKKFDVDKLRQWLKGKEVAVLFSNLLGQLPLLADADQMPTWWQKLLPSLDQHSWLSYHDLFSFSQSAKLPPKLAPGPIVPQLVEWAISQKKPLELIDHGTSELLPDSLETWTWNFSPKRTHIVGAVRSTL